MNVDNLQGFRFHIDVPDFESQIVTAENMTTIFWKFQIGNGRNDFGEEGFWGWVFFLLKIYEKGAKKIIILNLKEGKLVEKNEKVSKQGGGREGKKGCLRLAFWSQSADILMSAILMVPLLLLYIKTLHWTGWNSAAVMTSVNSSMLTGLMSTMSIVKEINWVDEERRIEMSD